MTSDISTLPEVARALKHEEQLVEMIRGFDEVTEGTAQEPELDGVFSLLLAVRRQVIAAKKRAETARSPVLRKRLGSADLEVLDRVGSQQLEQIHAIYVRMGAAFAEWIARIPLYPDETQQG
ncbi:MAG: hypothetical protein WD850_02910 [Candidatus Spechtbacterales bacterium]